MLYLFAQTIFFSTFEFNRKQTSSFNFKFSTMFKNTILIAASICIISCQSLENVNEKDSNGLKITYSRDKDTKLKEGRFIRYYENGAIMEDALYQHDLLQGEKKIFAENGDLQTIENYNKGQYEGPFKAFFADGKLEQEGQYVNNEMSGEWKTYYSGGQLKEIVTFANNLENGPFKEFYPEGNIKTEGNYLNGDKEQGELKEYLANGTLFRIANCNNGLCTTTWKADTTQLKVEN